MNLKIYPFIVQLLQFTTPLILLNYLIIYVYFSSINYTFYYPIYLIYLIFFTFSIIILLILIKSKNKNIDRVGYYFLLVTTIKLILSYLLIEPIINQESENNIEKINFFIIFISFSAIEVLLTSKLLRED